MRDEKLLQELLEAENEATVLAVLEKRGLLNDTKRWHYLGNMPNNQSIVHNQQSSPGAALVEKFTNGVDAILLRYCKANGIAPRGADAPESMSTTVGKWLGDLSEKNSAEIRTIAENSLVLYATGSKQRPSLSFFDAGEGQLADDFPKTFCSLIYGTDDGSYKGAVPFVQGRFNMGGTGVLPFCSDLRKLQLIVSRVPEDVAGGSDHEWAFTIFCLFPSKQDPSWRYLVGPDGKTLTAGSKPLGLVPKIGAKSGEVCAPRERKVASGTLIKMYDYKAPRSNICGELFKKLEDYLLRPAVPLRLVECRPEYKANVMGVTIWDRLSAWGKNKLEDGFEEGASIQIKLSTGETIPGEVRVFKNVKGTDSEDDQPQTGLRAIINGQSHAKRDSQFFRTKAVDKEHIAGSMLVTLDCTDLGQASRNALFMSNRETFREDPLLQELFKKLQKELNEHEGLKELNLKRYEEKMATRWKTRKVLTLSRNCWLLIPAWLICLEASCRVNSQRRRPPTARVGRSRVNQNLLRELTSQPFSGVRMARRQWWSRFPAAMRRECHSRLMLRTTTSAAKSIVEHANLKTDFNRRFTCSMGD